MAATSPTATPTVMRTTSALQDQRKNVARTASQRHANADFGGSLRGAERHDAVHTERRERETERRQGLSSTPPPRRSRAIDAERYASIAVMP